MKATFLFLGTGGSPGIPVIGCPCAVCGSPSPLNKRLRPSALLQVKGKNYLIDSGPDFREQALRFNITSLDGVFLTHAHYDHIGGVDELRIFYLRYKTRLPVLASIDTYQELRTRFHYLFQTNEADGSLNSQFDLQILEDDFGTTSFAGLKVQYVSYYQAKMRVTGYRIGSLAYISDIRDYDERIIADLQGTETLILSALRYTPSPAHFSLDEAIAFSEQVGAKRTFLTHISHDLEHDKTNRELPPSVRLAHDGLEISVFL